MPPGPFGPGHQAGINAHHQAMQNSHRAHQQAVDSARHGHQQHIHRYHHHTTSYSSSGSTGCVQNLIGLVVMAAFLLFAYSFFTGTPLDSLLNSLMAMITQFIANITS